MFYICLLVVPILCAAVSCLFGLGLDLHFGITDNINVSDVNSLVYFFAGVAWGVAFVVTGKLAGEQFIREGIPSIQHKPSTYFKIPLFALYHVYFGRGISLLNYLKGLWVAWPINIVIGWFVALKASKYLAPSINIESMNIWLFGIWAVFGIVWFLFVTNGNLFFRRKYSSD
jgi:hypothetical protein